MPEILNLAPLRKLDLQSVNAHVRELNARLKRVSELLDQLPRRLVLKGDMDAGSFRLTNVATAVSEDDALPLGQLEAELNELTRALREEFTSEVDESGTTPTDDDTTADGDPDDAATAQLEQAIPVAAPPNVAAVSAVGTTTNPILFALSDHTHGGVLGAPAGGGVAGQVAYFSSAFEVKGEVGFEYNEATDVLKASQMQSTVPTGTAPFIVASSSLVTNLNAHTVGGRLETAFLLLAGRPSTTNNALVSTDEHGTLTGSGAAAKGLILRGNDEATPTRAAASVVLDPHITEINSSGYAGLGLFTQNLNLNGAAGGVPLFGLVAGLTDPADVSFTQATWTVTDSTNPPYSEFYAFYPLIKNTPVRPGR